MHRLAVAHACSAPAATALSGLNRQQNASQLGNEASAAQGPLAKRQRLPSSRLTGHDLSVGQRGAKPVQPPQRTAQAASAASGAAAPACVASAPTQSLPIATLSGGRATSTEAATARASPAPKPPQPIGPMQWPSGQQPGPSRVNRCRRCPSRARHCSRQCSPRAQLGQWSGFKTNAVRSPFKFEGLFPALIYLRIVERDMPAAPVLCTFLALRVLHCDGGAWNSGCTCIARTAICAPQDA